MVPFKDILFKQQAYWVADLDIDALTPSVRLLLVSDPNSAEFECEVVFLETKEVSVSYFGEEDESKTDYLCTLLDVSDKSENGKHFYCIATDTVEVSFVTTAMPQITWLDPNKPYQTWQNERISKGKNA
ncbi:hypothetical protein [Alishewanella sp. HL-SH05]|uniref:hypothetical protein n=1 Tax=Alishewanella sp. HL-SH05 TaxID=3461145 RepID=UPI004041D865